MNKSSVFTHSSIKMANKKGVLCEHPLNENPNQITLKTLSIILPKYFMLFMRNTLSAGAEENTNYFLYTHRAVKSISQGSVVKRSNVIMTFLGAKIKHAYLKIVYRVIRISSLLKFDIIFSYTCGFDLD